MGIKLHCECHPTDHSMGLFIRVKDTEGPGSGEQIWLSRYKTWDGEVNRDKRELFTDEELRDTVVKILKESCDRVLEHHMRHRERNSFLYKGDPDATGTE